VSLDARIPFAVAIMADAIWESAFVNPNEGVGGGNAVSAGRIGQNMVTSPFHIFTSLAKFATSQEFCGSME
jgi:hypothetical protein